MWPRSGNWTRTSSSPFAAPKMKAKLSKRTTLVSHILNKTTFLIRGKNKTNRYLGVQSNEWVGVAKEKLTNVILTVRVQ